MRPTYSKNDYLPATWGDETCSWAAIVCALGFFLRIVLSAPVLNMLGFDYGDEEASMFDKIHPGNYFIFASFLILVVSKGNPLEHLIRIALQQTAFFVFFIIYVLITIYWVVRGPKGVGLMLDIHIVAPIMAIVFSYAPRAYCRTIAYVFVGIATVNSAVGIIEAATHMRIFAFNPEWEVLSQDYFRASAFLGHPLANAVFTVMALFVVLALRLPVVLKSSIFLIMLTSLIAFGGRSALVMCLVGLIILGIIEMRSHFVKRQISVLQLLMGIASLFIIPAVCFGLLYVVLHSGVGDRLLAYNSLDDESASARLLELHVFDHMSLTNLILGNDGDQILIIARQSGLENPGSDIESPWILMLMSLGVLMFTLWFCGWMVYVRELLVGASPAIKMAVIEYFAISTTSNSFGRKDLVYATLAGIIVCVKRIQDRDKETAT